MAISDYLKKGVQTGYKAPAKTSSAVSTPTVQAKPQTNWYKGAQPTARETGAQVYRVGMQDPSQQAELNSLFEAELNNPNGPIYSPYLKANSTNFTQTNQKNTYNAGAEWAEYQNELRYWASRTDRNYSDDEIIRKIDMKKYPTLAKMDEAAAMGQPMALLADIGYSRDAKYGVLWAARNPDASTGDAFMDSIQGTLGRGNQHKASEVNSLRDATSDIYAPYKAGATALDDLAYKYGMDGDFDMDWLNTQGRALLNGDEQMKKDYNRIYQVVTQTDKIDEELQRYRSEVNSAIAAGMDPSVVFDAGKIAKDYPELWKAYEGQRSGKLTETSRALDFDFNADVLAVQDAYLKKTGTMDDSDFANDVAALLGLPTMNNDTQKAVALQTNEQLQAAGSIFAKDFTPAESAAMYTASAGYMPTKQQLVQSILNGTAGDNEAYTSAMDAANAYASEFWLNSVNKLKELENHLQAFDEYDALVKEWDEVRNAENVDENARWEYEEKFAALEPQKSVWGSYESRDELVSAIENEKRIQANTLKMFSDAERLNTNGQSSGSVMPLLTFVDAFGGYESVRYPNTEWGKGMSEGSDWATVSKSIAEQEKSNGVMLRMINTALKQAEQYGLGEDYTRGLIAARDDIVRENQLMQYDKLHGAKDFDSQVSAFDKSQVAAEPKLFYVHGSASDAEVYRAGIVDMEKALAAYGDDDTRLLYPGQMTDSEKETYKYLFMTQGEEAATGYVEALIPMLDVRYRQGVLEQADEATSTIAGTIGANALTVLGNLTGVFSLAANAISSLTGEEVDPYSPTFSISAFSGRVRENTRKAIGEDNPWVVAYDAGMAAADSLTAALAGGGSQFITLALQSGNAANASLMEAKIRGASDQQAWMYAGASAAAEYFTERGPVADLLDAFANGGTGVFKETLIRGMLAEGFGEGLSEIVNTVSDNVIMQELSQYNASVEQYMAEGYTEEAAKSMAAKEVVTNVFYSGMLGAVSSAPTTAASYAAGTLAKRKENKFKSRAEAALSKAQSDGAGKPAQAAAMAAAMEAGGSNPEDADAAASAMVQADPQATYTLWSILDHSTDFEAIPAVELGALVPDSQTGNLFAMIKEEGATEENVAQLIETANQEMADPEVKARYDAAIASYAEGTSTIAAMVGADLSGIQNAQKNVENASRMLQNIKSAYEYSGSRLNTARLLLDEAQKAFSIDHSDHATAKLLARQSEYRDAKEMRDTNKAKYANAQKDYDAAKAELETVKQNTLAEIRQQGVTARDQIMANRQAVQEQKAAEDEAKRQEENVLEMEFQNYMAENAPNATPEQEAELRGYFMETMADMQNDTAAAEEKGEASSEEEQKKAVDAKNQRFIDAISKRFGLKVQFTDQLISGAKGAYSRSAGTLYLRSDLSQGEAIFEVALHELTHRAEGGGLAYNAFASSLLDIAYKGDKQKLKAEIRARRERYNNRFAQIAMSGAAPGNANLKPLSSADAKKELVADLTRKILYGDENLINQLVDSSPETAYTFMDWLKDTMKRLVGIKDPMVDRLEHTRSLFEAALNRAGQRPVQDAAHPNAMQFSIEQFARASGFSTVRTDGDVPYAIVDDDGNEVTKVTPEMIQNAPVGRLVQSALRSGTIDEATANAQYGMLSDLMTMICEYKDQAMIWELAGSELFSAIKSNSDAQYGTTVDFGTICSKTREVVNVMSETMLREGRGLTRDEVIEAYRQTHNVGLAVPCPVCYVFSRWMGVPSLLETMRKGQERFSNATNEQVNEYLHSVESKYAPNGEKVSTAVSSAKGKVTAKLDKIADQLMKSSLSGKEVSDLENQARALEAELADIELYNWVKQVLCKTDSKRNPILDENGNVTIDPDYKPVPNEILLDLRRTGEFASEYGKSWTFRTTRGAGMGKAILPYSGAELGDSVAGTKRWAAGQNPFFTGNDKVADRKVKNARVRARAQNLIGGQRFQSTSDYRPEWGLDYLSTFLEMQAIGAKGQLYTKVIEAVDMYATAGIEVNLSIMAKGNGFHTENGKNVLGVEDFSSVTGIDFSEAYKKTQQYDNVQMILVGLNDDHIRAAMSDDRISFIIPWHASGNSKTTLANLMEAVGESAGEATDYSKTQTDKVENQTPEQKAAWDLRSAILTGKLKKGVSAEQQAILDANPYLADLYNKFYVDKDSEAYGVKLSAKQAGQIFPHEYWDTSSTIENADVNGRRFVEYCESMGVTPRFSQFKDDAGYWKLLIDRRMYNRDGSYHHPKQIDVTNVKIESVAPEVSQAKVGTREQITEAAQRTIDEIRARVPEKPFDMTVEGVDLSDAQYSLAVDDRDQDYFDNIETHGDIDVFVAPTKQVPRHAKGGINNKAIETIAKRNPLVSMVGNTPTVHCPDIDADVDISGDGLVHGFKNDSSANAPVSPRPSSLRNAKAAMFVPELLSRAIEVNRSTKHALPTRPYGHVLLSAFSDNTGDYVVRMVVEHNTDKKTAALLDVGVVGALRAVNAKKFSPATFGSSGKPTRLGLSGKNTITVSQLIDAVKTEFDDTFANGVYASRGMTRRYDPKFSAHLQYSLSDDPEVQKENMRAWANRQGQRQFAGQTVQNSSAVPEEYKPTFMMPENLLYEKDTNREQVERAWQRIQQNGFEAEYNRLLEKEDVYDADDTAEANLMMAMALNPNTSDPAVFMSLALRYNEKGTENAQALQARQLFKKMTPTGAQVWVAGKAEKDLKERRRTHQPEAKMVDTAAETVKANVLRLTDGSDNTQMDSDNRWSIPLNPQQKALIDQYGLSEVNRPGLFYNRATVKQRMLEAIIATPNPLEVTGLGLNLIQRLEHMKRGEAVVTNADLNYIGARLGEFIGAGEEAGGRAAELALARAYEAYGNIKPATGWEKFRTQRYANMLLSAPSVIRNVIGNALQNTMNAAAHGTAVEVDKIISKFTGKRTLDHLTVKERADGWAAFVEETKNTFRDYYVDRANTAPNREKYSTSQRGRVFDNGIQEGMRNLENFLMSVGDRNVWKKAFVNSLAEQQRLADQGLLFNTDGTTMTHEQMVEQAEKDANYATFTEDNAVQELMGALAQKHPRIADVISVYLPFTGVPSNIVKRSLQFSPVGLAYTLGKWGVDSATQKNFDQRSFVDNLSRGLTGTGLMVAGALLAKMGLIKLGTEDEEGNKAYDAATAMGEQYTPYVYDPFTDTYVSMSTFAPALSPLVWGTAVMESLKGDEDAANALLNSLMYSTDSIFDASYLSGFSDIFNSQGSFTENLINAGMSNITSQMVPAMITQLANATDPYVRNTKDKNKITEMLKVTANKIPGLRQALPEKVDVAGDTVRTKGWWSFIDPFTRTNPSKNEALIEANRLYDLTGDTSVLPSDLLRSRTNTLNVGGGKKLILEDKDKEWYQKRYGEIWTTALMELMHSPKYARMDDDERAEALKDILTKAMSQAKKEAWEKYGEE